MEEFNYKSSYCDNRRDQAELDRFTEFVRWHTEEAFYDIETQDIPQAEVEFGVTCETLVDEDLLEFVKSSLEGMVIETNVDRELIQTAEGFKIVWT